MAMFASKVLCSIFLLQSFCQSAWAYEYCGILNLQSWYCPDSGSSIGYCCGHDSYAYYCCHYTAAWGLWYLWVGVVFFCILVSGFIACCRRSYVRRQAQQSTVHVATVTTTYPVTSPLATENPSYTVDNDKLPSYEQQGYPPKYDAAQHPLPQSSFPAPQQNPQFVYPPAPQPHTYNQQ